MNPKLIPFDLQIALKNPERVWHRDSGRAVQFAHFPTAVKDQRIAVQWGSSGKVSTYTEDGRVHESFSEPALFLVAPEPKWVPWEHIDEVPDRVWFRHKKTRVVHHVSALDPVSGNGANAGVHISGNGWITLQNLFDSYEWHPDRRHTGAWNVCGKETAL